MSEKEKKKKKTVTVRAPDYIPKREPIIKDTTGTEALGVFKVAKNVDRIFSFAVITTAVFTIFLSVYISLSSFNPFLSPFFIVALGFVGTINIVGGLLLLSKK